MRRTYNNFFAKNSKFPVTFKAPWALKKYLGAEFELKTRYLTRASNQLQRKIEKEVKKARFLALIPYTAHHSNYKIVDTLPVKRRV